MHAFKFAEFWVAGDSFTGRSTGFDNLGQTSSVFFSVTLTSISAVPEPTTSLLLAAALVGLASRRH